MKTETITYESASGDRVAVKFYARDGALFVVETTHRHTCAAPPRPAKLLRFSRYLTRADILHDAVAAAFEAFDKRIAAAEQVGQWFGDFIDEEILRPQTMPAFSRDDTLPAAEVPEAERGGYRTNGDDEPAVDRAGRLLHSKAGR